MSTRSPSSIHGERTRRALGSPGPRPLAEALRDLGRLIAQQPNQRAWSVFDGKVSDTFMSTAYPPISW